MSLPFENSQDKLLRTTLGETKSEHPTLLQNLLSETNIKISLYLGAFFVVASAAILGAFVDIFRIPLLIIGTTIFGVLSVAIRKRLPQPSFALFIVFSFFLAITANVIENTSEFIRTLKCGVLDICLSFYGTRLGRRDLVVHLTPVQRDRFYLVRNSFLPRGRPPSCRGRILCRHAWDRFAGWVGRRVGSQKMA